MDVLFRLHLIVLLFACQNTTLTSTNYIHFYILVTAKNEEVLRVGDYVLIVEFKSPPSSLLIGQMLQENR